MQPIRFSDVSFSSVALKWARGSGNGDPVTSYDIQYRVVGEAKWAQVGPPILYARMLCGML